MRISEAEAIGIGASLMMNETRKAFRRSAATVLDHRCQLAQRFEHTLGCIGKLRRVNALELASLMPASWNQIAGWLKRIDDLRQAA